LLAPPLGRQSSKNRWTAADPNMEPKCPSETSTNQPESQKNLFISIALKTSNLTSQNISYRILHFRGKKEKKTLFPVLHDVIFVTLTGPTMQNLTLGHFYFNHLFPICTISIPIQNINQSAD
jgi:hypothetical protein